MRETMSFFVTRQANMFEASFTIFDTNKSMCGDEG